MGRGGGGSAGEADVQQGPQNKNKRALYWAFMWIPMGTDGKDSPECTCSVGGRPQTMVVAWGTGTPDPYKELRVEISSRVSNTEMGPSELQENKTRQNKQKHDQGIKIRNSLIDLHFNSNIVSIWHHEFNKFNIYCCCRAPLAKLYYFPFFHGSFGATCQSKWLQ